MSETTTTEGSSKWREKELGAFWKRSSKAGESYLSGKINLKALGFDKDVQVIVFANKDKNQDTHPDLRMYISEERKTGTAPVAKPAAKAAPAKVAETNNSDLF